jgi:flagellar export protein FliJ
VLRVRRVQEDQARGELLLANRSAHLAAQRIEDRTAEYETRARPSGQSTYEDFERTLFLLDTAVGAIQVAKQDHRDALVVVDERRAEWSKARQKVAALERLQDRRRVEHALEARREEDRLVDDLVVARFARNALETMKGNE